MPFKIFDLHKDSVILIGQDYWNKLGGENTYGELLEIFEKVGQTTREGISKL